LVQRVQQRWPGIIIHARADAGCGVPWMYAAAERLGIDYTFGLSTNAVLKRQTEDLQEQASAAYHEDRRAAQAAAAAADLPYTPPPTRRRCDGFWYQAGSWPQARWVVAKAEANAQGTNRRFIVSNRPGARVLPEAAYDDYALRGESENRNKEFKCGLAMDRLSDHRFLANYFRLYLHAAAFNLLVGLRRLIADPLAVNAPAADPLAAGSAPEPSLSSLAVLAAQEALPLPKEALPEPQRRRYFTRRRRHDPLGEGQPATWRLLFIKVAAEVSVRARRIVVRLSASWPYLAYFQAVCQRLSEGPAGVPDPSS
jgi:hypothetical protein